MSDLLTSAQLDELTRLLADVQLVTPWLYSRERREVDTAQRAGDGDVYDGAPWSAAHYDNDPLAHAEGQFITAIVNAAPALIAAARELATLRAVVRALAAEAELDALERADDAPPRGIPALPSYRRRGWAP